MRQVLRSLLFSLPLLLLGSGFGTVRCSASSSEREPAISLGGINSALAIGDFDGDGKLDDLVVVQARSVDSFRSIYRISIRMGSGVRQNVSVVAPSGGFALLQRDVTGNGTPDLVLAAPWMDHPLAVLVNMDNGKGTFRVANPSAYPTANKVLDVPNCEAQSTLNVRTDAISAQRILPLDSEGRGRRPLPRPLLGSHFAPETGDAGRLLLFSLSGRAPPCFSNIS